MRARRTLRAVAAVAVAATFGFALAACDGSADGVEAGQDAAARPAGLDLVSDGRLTVCSDVPYPPFVLEDDQAPSGYRGFDIDLVQEIADRLDLELVVVDAGFDGIASGASLSAKRCDLAASAIAIDEEWADNLGFSEPYYDVEQGLTALVENDIDGLEDLAGRSLGVQAGSRGAAYAKEHVPEDAEIVEFDRGTDVHTAMLAGEVAAGLLDLPRSLARADEDARFEVVSTHRTGEQYGFAAELDDDALLAAVDERLEQIREDGTYEEIHDTYFGVG